MRYATRTPHTHTHVCEGGGGRGHGGLWYLNSLAAGGAVFGFGGGCRCQAWQHAGWDSQPFTSWYSEFPIVTSSGNVRYDTQTHTTHTYKHKHTHMRIRRWAAEWRGHGICIRLQVGGSLWVRRWVPASDLATCGVGFPAGSRPGIRSFLLPHQLKICAITHSHTHKHHTHMRRRRWAGVACHGS